MQKHLDTLHSNIAKCKKCELYRTAKHKVIYRGHRNPLIVFVGEAPGYNEDQKGEPFVGPAGKILNTVISRLNIAEYGVLNLVKCRPPSNRMEQRYIDVCAYWADRQIHIYDPRLVVTLGRWPTSYFFGKDVRITNVAGSTKKVDGRLVFAMLHPASILHSPKYKSIFDDCVNKLQVLTLQIGLRRKMTLF